ncbi:MAG: TlyA family RNA methyltransferase [Clostridiales bacterium]|nr:TlyA family RNA methyltransferase [Clostridiales bacterium]
MKQRVDSLLEAMGLAPSREQAQRLIMAGRVYADEVKVIKSSQTFEADANLSIRGEMDQFSSRGAHKLEKAMQHFEVDASGLICLDIGAASGGFTDILLRAGARKVYAIDVGYGQLDWKLRQDERVVVMERTNARALTKESFSDQPTLTVMDVSFISIKLIMPVAAAIMGEEGRFITLIKPQFEAGRGQVGKHGVVRDAKIHERVLKEIRDFCPSFGWQVQGLTFSPIKGPKGNIEFLADIRQGDESMISDEDIAALVKLAHQELRAGDGAG